MGTYAWYVVDSKNEEGDWVEKKCKTDLLHNTEVNAMFGCNRGHTTISKCDYIEGVPSHWKKDLNEGAWFSYETRATRYEGYFGFRHITLDKLMSFGFDESFETYGFMRLGQYKEWRKDRAHLSSYLLSCSDKYYHEEGPKLDKLLEGAYNPDEYVRFTSVITAEASMGSYMKDLIEELKSYSITGNYEDVMLIVMFG